jgi:hypothetical protein
MQLYGEKGSPMLSHLDAATTPFSLSLLSATKGNASKRLVPDAHGYPIKDPEHDLGISAGRVEHVQLQGLAGLCDLLARIHDNQALVHGVPKDSTPGSHYKLVLAEQYTHVPGTIARTLECFDYPPEVRLIMLDYDPEPEATYRLSSAEELIERLGAIWPAFGELGWLATVSTSSAIRNKQTQEWLRPPEGMHVYVLVTGDVARWRELVEVRLWLAGYGYCRLASPNRHTGVCNILERCLVDLTVFSPERLDYVAGAQIAKRTPFFQDRPPPELHAGGVLDLDSLPDITEDERHAYTALRAEARSRIAPEQCRLIRAHITNATPDLPEAAIEREIDSRLDRAARGELDATHPLYFDQGITCIAGTVSKAQDGKRLRDPLEPDYGPSQAVFHWRGGDWRIVSWAHGVKRVYQLIPADPSPPPPDDEDTADLLGRVEADTAAAKPQYRAAAGGMVWLKRTRDGYISIPLTNFTASIVSDILTDDGAETTRQYELEAGLHGRTYRVTVPAAQFASLGWVSEHLGAQAVLYPGQVMKDHARAAIQQLSDRIIERRLYRHTGWRRHADGTWAYCHGGGALGQGGQVPDLEISLPRGLERLALPDPPRGDELKIAIRASLRMLEVAPDPVSVPLYAGIWRAVLGAPDCGLHLTGPTGAAKTEQATLAQQHFGATFDSRHLPGSWLSTGNSLEDLAFTAKDAILVIDDFAPGGTTADVARMHREADRVLRAQGNRAGRQRMRADGTLRPAKPPRGLILSTGEDIPRGQSLRARLVIVEVSPGDVAWARLTACQQDGANGQYAQAMAGYLQWLAARYTQIQDHLARDVADLRAQLYEDGQHQRSVSNVAHLAVGIQYWLDFAQEVGAISRVEREVLWHRCWAALLRVSGQQQRYQEASEPTQHFLRLLSAAIASGRAHLASLAGDEPAIPQAYGWRSSLGGDGYHATTGWRAQGKRIGWIEGDDLYLEPEASYAETQALASQQGEGIGVSAQTMRKRLHERHLLVNTGKEAEGRETLLVRRTIEGRRREVLHLRVQSLTVYTPENPDQPDHDPDPPSGGQVGPDQWSGNGQGPDHGKALTEKASGDSGQVGQDSDAVKRSHVEEGKSHDSLAMSRSGDGNNLTTKPDHACEHDQQAVIPEGHRLICGLCLGMAPERIAAIRRASQ